MTRKRHRRRGGRPRKVGVERHPSGQIKREARDAGPTAETIAHRAAELEAAGASPLFAGMQEAGWYLGRLYLAGQLNGADPGEAGRERGKERYLAAERLWKNTQRYAGMLLAPRQPEALAIGEPKGRNNAEDEEGFIRAKARHDACFKLLQARGYKVQLATSRAINEQEVPLPHLLEGLDALADGEQDIRRHVDERIRRHREKKQAELAETEAA